MPEFTTIECGIESAIHARNSHSQRMGSIVMGIFVKNWMAVLFIVLSSVVGLGSPTPVPNFEVWKQEQIVRGQNEVVKLTNKLLMSQSQDHQLIAKAQSQKIFNRKSDEMRQADVGSLLKQAQQNLEIAKELEFDDYLELHMDQLMSDPDILKEWLGNLSKDEVVEAFQYLAKRGNPTLLPPIDVGAHPSNQQIKAN